MANGTTTCHDRQKKNRGDIGNRHPIAVRLGDLPEKLLAKEHDQRKSDENTKHTKRDRSPASPLPQPQPCQHDAARRSAQSGHVQDFEGKLGLFAKRFGVKARRLISPLPGREVQLEKAEKNGDHGEPSEGAVEAEL